MKTRSLLPTGLLLQEVTMAGLHEQRFTEEKPLLRGQDTELENSDAFLSAVDTDWKVSAPGFPLLPWLGVRPTALVLLAQCF
uniref:Uncharacterized protein n=1 Tax=Varanus komodoensis TaxID=61221 RepID=A0A8D2KZZ0_VARKO